jgi:hypothetical protein
MTNKEFDDYIDKEFYNIITPNMITYFNKCFVESQFKLLGNIKSPLKKSKEDDERKYIKNVLNSLLKNVNYNIQYVNRKNTTRDCDKLSISQYKNDVFKILIPKNEVIQPIVNDYYKDAEEMLFNFQPLNVNKAKNQSGGYSYTTFKDVMKVMKSGKIKIVLKPNFDYKVYKHNATNVRFIKNTIDESYTRTKTENKTIFKFYDITPNKKLNKILKKNKESCINYKDVFHECVTELIHHIFTPVVVKKVETEPKPKPELTEIKEDLIKNEYC